MRKLIVLATTLAAVAGGFVFAAPALANYTVNLGHNCTATAYTPVLTHIAGLTGFTAEGATNCARSDGRVSQYLEVCAEVDFGGSWVLIPPYSQNCDSGTSTGNWGEGVGYAPCSPGAEYASWIDVSDTGSGWNVSAYFASWQNFSVFQCP